MEPRSGPNAIGCALFPSAPLRSARLPHSAIKAEGLDQVQETGRRSIGPFGPTVRNSARSRDIARDPDPNLTEKTLDGRLKQPPHRLTV